MRFPGHCPQTLVKKQRFSTNETIGRLPRTSENSLSLKKIVLIAKKKLVFRFCSLFYREGKQKPDVSGLVFVSQNSENIKDPQNYFACTMFITTNFVILKTLEEKTWKTFHD